MKTDPLEGALLSVGMIIVGIGLIFFRQALRDNHDDWNERVPWFLRSTPVDGRLFSVSLWLIAIFSIGAGVIGLIRLW